MQETDAGSIPAWGRSPGEGNGYPLQYPCLENPMDNWVSEGSNSHPKVLPAPLITLAWPSGINSGPWKGTGTRQEMGGGHRWVKKQPREVAQSDLVKTVAHESPGWICQVWLCECLGKESALAAQSGFLCFPCLFFQDFFFFVVNHFKSLYWICYNIAFSFFSFFLKNVLV